MSANAHDQHVVFAEAVKLNLSTYVLHTIFKDASEKLTKTAIAQPQFSNGSI